MRLRPPRPALTPGFHAPIGQLSGEAIGAGAARAGKVTGPHRRYEVTAEHYTPKGVSPAPPTAAAVPVKRFGVLESDCEAAGPPFRIAVEQRQSRNLLVLSGQLGLDAAGQLRDEAQRLATSACDVDMDWRDAETVTAGSLQVLLALAASLTERERALRVAGDNPHIRRLLELAGLSAQFPVAEPLS